MTIPNTFLFTVDVEDWYQVENFKPAIPFNSWDMRELRVEQNTRRILDLLDDTCMINSPKATFFMLGWIARKFPGLVKEIRSRGHEIASHGINHRLCTDEPADVLRNDLNDSKKLLEDIIGDRVTGYRAPSFSINNEILKIIEESGYSYDSSYNSFDKHGRYGKLCLDGFEKKGIAFQVSDNFHELPISNLTIHNSQFIINSYQLPWGGGGYFRLTPYAIFRLGIQKILKNEKAYSFYLHPWELDPSQPRVRNAPAVLKFRHYVNLKSTAQKIKRMLNDFRDCRFVTCREYLEQL